MSDALEGLQGLPHDATARARAIAQLREAMHEARARWPAIELDLDAQAAELLGSVRGAEDVVTALAALVLPDIVLARACARGDPGAIAAFTAEYQPVWQRAFEGTDDARDLEQSFVERLLVAAVDRPPRIAAYEGRGTLRVWVRVAASRARIDAERRRHARPVVAADDLSRVADGGLDPELAFIKSHYRGAFREAFAQAWDELEPGQRNLVRLRIIDGLDNAQIAAALSIHIATVKRRLADTRERLLERTRTLLGARLSLAPSELDSVLRLVASRFEVTARIFLRTRGP